MERIWAPEGFTEPPSVPDCLSYVLKPKYPPFHWWIFSCWQQNSWLNLYIWEKYSKLNENPTYSTIRVKWSILFTIEKNVENTKSSPYSLWVRWVILIFLLRLLVILHIWPFLKQQKQRISIFEPDSPWSSMENQPQTSRTNTIISLSDEFRFLPSIPQGTPRVCQAV